MVNEIKRKNKKYKLKRTLAGLAATGSIIIIGGITLINGTVYKYSHGSGIQNINSQYSLSQITTTDNGLSNNAQTYYDDSVINVIKSNEKEKTKNPISKTPINYSYASLEHLLNDIGSKSYTYEKYYDFENTLNTYNNSTYKKCKSNELLDENGLLDYNKLYKRVIYNNKEYKSQKSNAINTFLSEMDNNDVLDLCKLISEVCNKNVSLDNMPFLSDTLSNLKILKNETSAASAYVSEDLILSVNYNMIDIFSDMQKLTHAQDNEEITKKSVLVHEIMHLIQYASNDNIKENGLETGPFRLFNEDSVNVNSLYITWLLEAAAEMNMSNELGINTLTYSKKINYMNSYSLSKFFDDDFYNKLINISTVNNIEELYSSLGLYSEIEKRDILNLLYSIEITQVDCDDFWKFYEEKTGKTLTQSEHDNIRKQIRTDVIENLSKDYYKGLINSIIEGKINDLETLFYFMRIWELDCYNHLFYTQNSNLYNSDDFILWLSELNNNIIKSICENSNLDYNTALLQYDEYRVNNEIGSNCDLSNFQQEKQDFLNDCFENYSVHDFAQVSKVADYIKKK